MMKKIAVIGGGLSGLSAAVHLTRFGVRVDLYEASLKLGGKAYSFLENTLNKRIDNGQHILAGCYKNTFEFLDIIGALPKLNFSKKFDVGFINTNKRIVELKSSVNLYPFDLMSAILTYRALSFRDRLSVIRFILKLPFQSVGSLKKYSAREWLEAENQTHVSIKALWEIISVGTLNSNLREAGAIYLYNVLKELFLTGEGSAILIPPETDLSALFCDPAEKYLIAKKASIQYVSKLFKLNIKDEKLFSINVSGREYEEYDGVIVAIPPYALKRALSPEFAERLNLDKFKYSPIVSIVLQTKNNFMGGKYWGFIDSQIHWVFDRGDYWSVVISGADEIVKLPEREIIELCLTELENRFDGFYRADIKFARVIKEKRATFIPSIEIHKNRPQINIGVKKLYLAGDWIASGFPGTIEGAILNGKKAAKKALEEIS